MALNGNLIAYNLLIHLNFLKINEVQESVESKSDQVLEGQKRIESLIVYKKENGK